MFQDNQRRPEAWNNIEPCICLPDHANLWPNLIYKLDTVRIMLREKCNKNYGCIHDRLFFFPYQIKIVHVFTLKRSRLQLLFGIADLSKSLFMCLRLLSKTYSIFWRGRCPYRRLEQQCIPCLLRTKAFGKRRDRHFYVDNVNNYCLQSCWNVESRAESRYRFTFTWHLQSPHSAMAWHVSFGKNRWCSCWVNIIDVRNKRKWRE